MRLQPNRNYVSNDDIQTPPLLARRLVRHFRPTGRILEPCKGAGNFLKHLPKSAAWCELKEGRDFFTWTQKVDWIITNPPWSQMRRFLQQAMSVADHVVFLISLARGMRSWPVESAPYSSWLFHRAITYGRGRACATSRPPASVCGRLCCWICRPASRPWAFNSGPCISAGGGQGRSQIGRASCRERV